MFLDAKYHAVSSVHMVFIGKDFEKCDGEELRDSAGTGLGQGKAIFIPAEKAIFFTARKRKLKKFFRSFSFSYLFIHLTNIH